MTPFGNMPAIAEETQLPLVELQQRGGGGSFCAYANELVVGKTPREMNLGRGSLYPLWHLSMTAPKGYGSTLMALYAALVNSPPRDIYIHGVGHVMLGHHQKDLVDGGYSVHWNYNQVEISLAPSSPGSRALRGLHGLVESRQLTHADPIQAETQSLRNKKDKGKEAATKKTKGKQSENVSLSTARTAAIKEQIAGQQAKVGKKQSQKPAVAGVDEKPLFLLFVPGSWTAQGLSAQQKEEKLAQLYLSFLDRRFPLPLLPEWATPLWQAALAATEVETLGVWSYPKNAFPKKEAVLPVPEGTHPFMAEAYLCKPSPVRVLETVQSLITAPYRAAVEEAQEVLEISSFRELAGVGAY